MPRIWRSVLRPAIDRIIACKMHAEPMPEPAVHVRTPTSPWRLGPRLPAAERARLQEAGADIERDGIVSWPGTTLRRFMLAYVLAHELGHHVLQHERRLRGERAARTREHEARAEAIARRLRAQLD